MNVVIWSKPNCVQCEQAKTLLKMKHVPFEERKIGEGWTVDELRQLAPNAKSVPQIFVNDELIGGYQQLQKLFVSQSQY